MLRPSPSIPLLLLHLSPSGVFFSVIPNTPDSKASSCLNSVHPLFSWESRSFNPTFPSEANDTEAQRQVSVLSLFRWTAVSLSLALTHSSSLGTDFFLFHCTVIMCCREEIFLRSSFSLTTFHILLSENRHRLLVFSFCLFFFFLKRGVKETGLRSVVACDDAYLLTAADVLSCQRAPEAEFQLSYH